MPVEWGGHPASRHVSRDYFAGDSQQQFELIGLPVPLHHWAARRHQLEMELFKRSLIVQ